MLRSLILSLLAALSTMGTAAFASITGTYAIKNASAIAVDGHGQYQFQDVSYHVYVFHHIGAEAC